MRKYLQILSLITIGLVSLATIHKSVFAAEVLFECASVSLNSDRAYLQIDAANGRVTARDIVVTYTVTPRSAVGAGNPLRPPSNGYQVWWSGGDVKNISFSEQGNGSYRGSATISGYPVDTATYQIRLETTNDVVIPCSGANSIDVTVDGDPDYVFAENTVFSGVGCRDIVGHDIAVAEGLFTCAKTSTGNVDITAFNSYPGGFNGCGADNPDASTVKCSNFLNANPSAVLACISCPSENPLADQAASVSWGNVCPTGTEGLPCYSSRSVGDSIYDNIYTCRVSTGGALKCLGTPYSRERVDDRCAVGENECSARATDTFAVLRCSGAGLIGQCKADSVLNCNPGGRILAKISPCATEDFCFGRADNDRGVCITSSELTALLADSDYLLRLGITPAQLRQARDEFGLEVVPETDIDTSVTSPAAGPCNCPGLRSLCVTDGKFNTDALKSETAASVREKLNGEAFNGLNQDEKTNAVSCFTCVTQGNTWTDSFGCVNTTVSGLFTTVLRIALGVIGGIVLIRFIVLGYQYAFSSQKMKLEEAVKNVLATLGALLLVLFSVVILRIIGVNILDVVPPGFFGS